MIGIKDYTIKAVFNKQLEPLITNKRNLAQEQGIFQNKSFCMHSTQDI